MVRMKDRRLSRTEGLEIVQKWLLGAQFWRVFTELATLYYRKILSRKNKWSDVYGKKRSCGEAGCKSIRKRATHQRALNSSGKVLEARWREQGCPALGLWGTSVTTTFSFICLSRKVDFHWFQLLFQIDRDKVTASGQECSVGEYPTRFDS